jgi:hypothetical protein
MKAQEIEDALAGLPEDRRHAADVAAGAMRAAALDALRRGRAGGGTERGRGRPVRGEPTDREA